MANKAFDASKFRKNLTKSITGLGIGFTDPTDWISTGNYALNYLISGDFNKGVPLGKVTVLAGEPQAGKSYIASGNIVKAAQDQDICQEKRVHGLGRHGGERRVQGRVRI